MAQIKPATRNQLGVAFNKAQTEAKRVLVVCSAGALRSPTIANILHKEFDYNTRSCGSNQEYALIPITGALIAWADEIMFANKGNYDEVDQGIPDTEVWGHWVMKKKRILDIEDDYDWMCPSLVKKVHYAFGIEKGVCDE